LSSQDTSEQEQFGRDLLSLAEQIRLEVPNAKLSEVHDWVLANGIGRGQPKINLTSNGSRSATQV
jgi:hypothetical protein